MDGLECYEIKFSELEIDNEKYRFDSEFYLKKYVQAYKKIKEVSHTKINDIYSAFTDFHANGSYETIAKHFQLLDTPNYAYMVRTTDLEKENYVSDVKYITKEAYNFLAKSKLYGGELLINKIGSPGRAFLMPHLDMPVSLGMNLFMLRIKECVQTNETIIYLFLQTKNGRNIIERKVNGTVPLTIDKDAIKSLYVPVFSTSFIEKITEILEKKQLLLKRSKELYIEAEKILMETIDLNVENPNNETISIKSINDSLKLSGRLDAEYYQPKYEMLECQLDNNVTVGSSCKIYDNNYMPSSDSIYQYIELSNVDTLGGISKPDRILGKELPTRARRIVKDGQIIISSIEGSLQSCALVTKEVDDSLCSTGFYVVDSDIYNSETLLILFKSAPIQMLMKKRCSGTILTAISKEELLKMPLPYIDNEAQKEIAAKVQESFKLRQESKRILECAVKAVEMAIESDENTAIMWLEQELEVF